MAHLSMDVLVMCEGVAYGHEPPGRWRAIANAARPWIATSRHARPFCWPVGMQVIVHKESSLPGAQPQFINIDGHRFTAFANSQT
jgi:hypothetical protein